MPPTRKTIALSKHLTVTRKKLEKGGVYDTTLGVDTRLFIDPKLLVKSKIPEFKNSRSAIIKYFALLLRVLRSSHKSKQLFDNAVGMLAVREPIGLAIGYGSTTDRGTAISKTVAKKILLSASEILSVGIDDEELVELLSLFVNGFGPDSISDLTASIIYQDLCAYTERVSRELKTKTKSYIVGNRKFRLPKHPFKDKQIIFVPHTLLRPLPVAVSWEEISKASAHNQNLRKQFNEIVRPAIESAINDVKGKTPAEKEEFRENLDKLLDLYRRVQVESYSLNEDEKGYYAIQPYVDSIASKIKPSFKPTTLPELIKSVRELVQQYQRSIEHVRGNTLLYRKTPTGKVMKDKPHNEDVAQILFHITADLFCQQNNILISREPFAGSGKVDFSLGTGYHEKVLVEIKKSHNPDLEKGYLKQIDAYLKADKAKHAFYVVIVIKEAKKAKKTTKDYPLQLRAIQQLFEDNKKKGIPTPELIIIDGLIRSTPSKLKK